MTSPEEIIKQATQEKGMDFTEFMASQEEIIKQTIQEQGKDLPEEKKKEMEGVMKKIFLEGASPREAMGFGKPMMDFAYNHGYRLFHSGNYEKALGLFLWLSKMEPLEYLYAFNVAACYHHMNNYEEAAARYILPASLDNNNPTPLFYMADCYISLKLPNVAIPILENAIKLAEGKPEFANIYELSKVTLKKLKSPPQTESQGEKK